MGGTGVDCLHNNIYIILEVIFPLNDFILVSFKNGLSHKYLISLTITNDRVHL